MDLTEATRAHEQLFNESVRTGDFTEFIKTFAEDAVMSFDGVPVGPYRGREAIAQAYASRPPSDTMSIWSIEEVGPDTADVRFEWDAGGRGAMRVKWQDGLIAGMTISFWSDADGYHAGYQGLDVGAATRVPGVRLRRPLHRQGGGRRSDP